MAAALTGIATGWFLRFIISLGKKGSMELEIKEMILSAREEVERITSEAEKKASKILKEAKEEAKETEEKAEKTEDRLITKESYLDKRQTDIDKDADEIKEKNENIEKLEEELKSKIKKYVDELEHVSNFSESEAREKLIDQLEKEYEEDVTIRLQKLDSSGREKLEKKAQEILATTIQRLSNNLTPDVFTNTVNLPSEDMKGKIIGKEGRNIKTFERKTGVEIIIDDSPSIVTLSSFDPVRRYIAKVSLEKLISLGKIQPAKIEEVVENTEKEIKKIIKEKGDEAAYRCGIFNLDSRIISILGRLHFRTSYGQNVLEHSIEMSHIAGMLAEELGADVKTAKAGALLHDIGKAIDHEAPGTHVEIGRRILQKFGADEEIVKAMQSHHEEYPYETIESIIVQIADSLSGGRPGARRDTVEHYLKRLDDLEKIAVNFEGVNKAYALEAGREIRIFVSPNEVSDLEARNLARDIAVKIEKDLKYPGEIKVTLIRENRITEYAR